MVSPGLDWFGDYKTWEDFVDMIFAHIRSEVEGQFSIFSALSGWPLTESWLTCGRSFSFFSYLSQNVCFYLQPGHL
jgi:hypothetical protein